MRETGSTPPLPLCFLLVPRRPAPPRVQGRVRTNATRPLPAPRPAVRLPYGGCVVMSRKARKLGSGARRAWLAYLNRISVSAGVTCISGSAFWAKFRDDCSSPSCPVSWCAGAVVYTPRKPPKASVPSTRRSFSVPVVIFAHGVSSFILKAAVVRESGWLSSTVISLVPVFSKSGVLVEKGWKGEKCPNLGHVRFGCLWEFSGRSSQWVTGNLGVKVVR